MLSDAGTSGVHVFSSSLFSYMVRVISVYIDPESMSATELSSKVMMSECCRDSAAAPPITTCRIGQAYFSASMLMVSSVSPPI